MTDPVELRAVHRARVGVNDAHIALPSDISRGRTSALSLGYLRTDLLTADELTKAKDSLKKLALIEGFALGAIYVEQSETTPVAFEALIDAISRYDVKAVVVPSLLHFVELAATNNIKGAFERATGARVIVVNSFP